MKVLFVIHSLEAGGAERVTVNLANYWARNSWQVVLVTLRSSSRDAYFLDPLVVRIALGQASRSKTRISALANNAKRVLALRRVLLRTRPNVAIGMMTTCSVLLGLARIGIDPLVCIGSERAHPPRVPIGTTWARLRRLLYGRLDAIAVLSDATRGWVLANTRAKKVSVIPNPVVWPLAPSTASTSSVHAGIPRKQLLAVGRLHRDKGFDILVDVFATLTAELPEWELVIVGEGPEREALERQIERLHLNGTVRLAGHVDNIVDFYRAADLFVLPSRSEGFPNALIEAMAEGLPPVSFDCETGPRSIIRHEVDGLLIPDGNTLALRTALRRLMIDPAARNALSDRAKEVRQRFALPHVANLWRDLFHELGIKKGF